MKQRSEIKIQARKAFTAQYGDSLAGYLIYTLATSAASVITFGLGSLLLMPPMMVGYSFFTLNIYRGSEADIPEIFTTGFKDYARSLGGILWMELFTFLWSLLFIVPGIIKALAYFMTPYILADCPGVAPTQALKLSMRMTKGHKGKVFVMGLSFIGWILLSGLTFGLLQLFYTGPYMGSSFAGLYDELKNEALEKGVVSREELA